MKHQLAFLNTLINLNEVWVTNHNKDFYSLGFTNSELSDYRLHIELHGFNWGILLFTKDEMDNFSPINIKNANHPLFEYQRHYVKNLQCALNHFQKTKDAIIQFSKDKTPFACPFQSDEPLKEMMNQFTSFLKGNHLVGKLENNMQNDQYQFLTELGYKSSQQTITDEMKKALNNTYVEFCKQLKPVDSTSMAKPLSSKILQQYNLVDEFGNPFPVDTNCRKEKVGLIVQGIKENISNLRGQRIDLVIFFSEEIRHHYPYISEELDDAVGHALNFCSGVSHIRAEEFSSKHNDRNLRLSFIAQHTELTEKAVFTERGKKPFETESKHTVHVDDKPLTL